MQSELKTLLISNMYPSIDNPSYGVFVKNFELAMKDKINIIDKVVIKGRGKNILDKICKYIAFSFTLLYKGVTRDFNTIYVHYINHTAIPVLLLLLLTPNKKIVLNTHGGDIFHISRFSKIISLFSYYLIKKADIIVCPSFFFKSILQKKFSLENKVIFPSPSGGINTRMFKPIDGHKTGVQFNIGFISRIDKNKGWDDYIEAINHLKMEYPSFNFKSVIVGDGIEKVKMQELLEKRNLSNIIEYKGLIPQNKLPNIINSFDVFIFPTKIKGESLGLVALEALACGVPVIGSNIPAICEYIDDSSNGFIYEYSNYIELANYIYKYYKLSDKQKNIMIKSSRQTALRYDKTKVASDLAIFINKTLSAE